MIRTALLNPYLVVVGALAVLVLGLVSYLGLPFLGIQPLAADLLPTFKTPAVQIVTFYPGMPPEVMERDIMSRLERWTGQSVGIEHQEAKAMLGVCVVKDFFHEDISMDTAMSQVTSYAVSDMFYLPPGTIPPMVMPFDPTASVPLCLVVVSNPEMNEKELYDIAYFELRNRLQSISGVIAPAVYGGKLRRILCYVDREKLEAFGLSLMDVQQALRKQNVLIPAGNAKMGEYDFQIFTNSIPKLVEDINKAPIKVVNGNPVLIGDVGEVRDAGQIQTNIVRVNGSRQVYIPIYRQPGANTIEIVDKIKNQLGTILNRLKDMNRDNPKMQSLVLSVAMDQSLGVRQSINGLQLAALLGAGLAGLVVFFFLRSFRSTFIIVLAIPLAILAAVMGLYIANRVFGSGDTINAMTLGGLALAIGILVDQSIVVLENVVRHVQMGKKPLQAAYDGAREVAVPILVSTITFVVVFFPIVFLTGLAKFLFTPLAISASIAIVASYILAMTLIPAYCAQFLKVRSNAAENAEGAEGAERPESAGGFARWYGKTLNVILAVRPLIVLGAAGLFVASLAALTLLGQELIPPVDAGQFTIYARMKSGTRIELTESKITEIEKSIIEEVGRPDPAFALGDEQIPQSNMQMLISNIGVLMDWPAAYTPNTGPMDSFLLVQLKGKRNKAGAFETVGRLREKFKKQFPEVEFAFDTGGMMTAALNMGEPSPIHFQVTGSNLETAQEIAAVIKKEAEQVEGTADVRVAQRMDYPILQVNMDRVLASSLGVTPDDVMKNLVSATNSSINFDPAFWIDERNGNHYFMGVQYREEDINSLNAILDVPVTSNQSETPIYLRDLVKTELTKGPAVISHRNITRATDIYANVLPGHDVGSVVAAIEKRLEKNAELEPVSTRTARGQAYKVDGAAFKDKGYQFEMQGEVRSMRESFSMFAGGLIIATVLVYLVMVAQFRSFMDPFIVLLTVPLGFIGVVALLLLTGTNLSIMAFMGIVMMVGIVVEYSIVLVDFANRRVEEGLSVREAIIDAAQVRLRPILMTSLTTWLALLPMALGFGGGEANVPLARAIIGGVLGATVLSLVVVPCLYVMLKRPAKGKREELALS